MVCGRSLPGGWWRRYRRLLLFSLLLPLPRRCRSYWYLVAVLICFLPPYWRGIFTFPAATATRLLALALALPQPRSTQQLALISAAAMTSRTQCPSPSPSPTPPTTNNQRADNNKINKQPVEGYPGAPLLSSFCFFFFFISAGGVKEPRTRLSCESDRASCLIKH